MPRVAILFAKGGMGDVGKMAIMHALKQEGLEIRGLGREPEKVHISESVTKVDPTGHEQLELIKIDPASDVEGLKNAFKGVDAVVSCVGCRQPGFPRWAAPATQNVITAMKANNVTRLVMISSMGIRESYPPLKWSRLYGGIFTCMMKTIIRSAVKDLTKAELAAVESGIDYLIVRPTGLDPSMKPKGIWKVIQEPTSERLTINIAKEDVAQFMLQEALQPTLHRQARTIGWPVES